jgi:hypothetical protein
VEPQRWTVEELRAALDRYEREPRDAGKAENTVNTTVDRARRFLDWLAGV